MMNRHTIPPIATEQVQIVDNPNRLVESESLAI